jgi:hypothetical protein
MKVLDTRIRNIKSVFACYRTESEAAVV